MKKRNEGGGGGGGGGVSHKSSCTFYYNVKDCIPFGLLLIFWLFMFSEICCNWNCFGMKHSHEFS